MIVDIGRYCEIRVGDDLDGEHRHLVQIQGGDGYEAWIEYEEIPEMIKELEKIHKQKEGLK